jgi:hypothetical protein
LILRDRLPSIHANYFLIDPKRVDKDNCAQAAATAWHRDRLGERIGEARRRQETVEKLDGQEYETS